MSSSRGPAAGIQSPSALRRALGVTLIELMIVLAIVAIVMAVAIPSYQAYTYRVNRTEALDAMLAAAACQERFYTRTNRYDTTPADCAAAALDRYAITWPVLTEQTFQIRATPTGGQTEDDCGVLALNETGAKQAKGGSTEAAVIRKCWGGR